MISSVKKSVSDAESVESVESVKPVEPADPAAQSQIPSQPLSDSSAPPSGARRASKPKIHCAHGRCKKCRVLMACPCGKSFCLQHFTPTMHQCSRSSGHHSKERLQKELVKVEASKLDRV